MASKVSPEKERNSRLDTFFCYSCGVYGCSETHWQRDCSTNLLLMMRCLVYVDTWRSSLGVSSCRLHKVFFCSMEKCSSIRRGVSRKRTVTRLKRGYFGTRRVFSNRRHSAAHELIRFVALNRTELSNHLYGLSLP